MKELPDLLAEHHVHRIIKTALEEDLSEEGDATTNALVPEDALVKASVISRGDYVISGTTVAAEVFGDRDRYLQCAIELADGARAEDGDIVMTVDGKARPILEAERTALNFLQRMTGIATQTRQFVDIAGRRGVQILDTRKTTPGMRLIEKYAVLCGGGINHRKGLYDMVLIKDNHRKLWEVEHGGELGAAVKEARRLNPGKQVEIEVESVEEMEDALQGAPDWILLDNMPVEIIKHCVEVCAGRCKLEASGRITLGNVEEVAGTGVDAISLGCLTHSIMAADLSLEIA